MIGKKVSVTDVCDFEGGSQPPKNEWSDKPVNNYVRMLQIRDFTQGKKEHIAYVKDSKKLRKCVENDVLIGRYGASVGKILTGLEGAYNVAIMKTIPNFKKLDRKFLYFLLKSPHFQFFIQNVGVRAAQAGFSKKDLKKYKFFLPESLDNQIKIANLLSQVESLIAKREESIKLLDELLKSTFLNMFGDPVLNPKNLKKVRIDSFTKVETGATPNRKKEVVYYMNGTIHWVKTTEVNNSYIEKTEEKITELALSESNCKIFPKNTLLLAMYGQGKTRGKVGFLNIDASTNQACAAILPDKKYSSLFLFYQLQFLYDHIRILGRGGGQPNLNLSIVKKYEVLSPIYKDNADIKQFEKITQQIEQTKQQYKKSLDELKNLFGSLSQRAFRGEL